METHTKARRRRGGLDAEKRGGTRRGKGGRQAVGGENGRAVLGNK